MYQTKNLGLNITEIDKDKLQAFNFDIDLGDNFKAIDEKTLSHRNITNCLLEVPQDIKLELVDGVITLKAGSKVYVPNGFEADGVTRRFKEVTITSDSSNSTKGDGDVLLAVGEQGSLLATNSKSHTVTERPETTTGIPLYYNITTNKIEFYDNSIWNSNASFPIAIAVRTNNGISSIKQIFNGISYIGSTVVALPGVKCLIPNGRNEDGSLNNIEYTTEKVITHTSNYTNTNATLVLDSLGNAGVHDYFEGDVIPSKNGYAWVYHRPSNLTLQWDDTISKYIPKTMRYVRAAKVDITNGQIKSIIPKLPFHAVDHNDYSTKIAELESKIETLQAAVEALQG